jgi:nucleotide-binding universal stress UspA family protein
MKAILAPTDFSETSINAIDYAVEIAKSGQAKLVLFNSYRLPVVTSETALLIPSIEELEQNSRENLARIKKDIHGKHGNGLAIECVSSCGFAVEEINRYARENNIGLIVVGMQGAGYMTERFFGSTTTSLMQVAGCPVLSIDKQVRFKNPKKIVLASDYLDTGDKDVLSPLRDFVKLFNSHVYVLNVITPSEARPEVEETVNDYISFEDSLKGMEHTFHYIKDKDVVKGINDFVIERKMDMIVMIPRKHSVFETLFNEPVTRKMAFHSSLPLLTLHA